MAITIPKNIVKEYSIGILKIQFEYRRKKWNLLENLWKYMIQTRWDIKENLSSNIDEMLYGKK